jgi:glycosyltransferase involved in cell wall biosynthesis
MAVPEVSVVVPTHNRLPVLTEVLSALVRQEGAPPFEVVVVDDGSTDGTAEWLRSRSFDLSLRVFTQENRGPAAARNTGVAVSAGRWVAFLGDDTVPAVGWLAAHRAAHRRHGSTWRSSATPAGIRGCG